MKAQNFFIAVAVFLSILALVTTGDKSPSQASVPAKLDSPELVQTKNDLESLRSKLVEQNKRITKLELKAAIVEQKHSEAYFTPTDSDYRILDTGIGNVMLALRNLVKVGDGYKLFFQVGNPTTMTMSGLKGKITWRPEVDYQKYFSDTSYSAEIDKKTHQKDFEVLSDIIPGTWNDVTITIGPANEETIGEISINSLRGNAVRFLRSN